MEGGADGAVATVHMVALQEADTGELIMLVALVVIAPVHMHMALGECLAIDFHII